MAFAHLIVVLHCLYGIGDAPAALEIAYSDEEGKVASDAWIGFGGDMDPNPYNDKMVGTKRIMGKSL